MPDVLTNKNLSTSTHFILTGSIAQPSENFLTGARDGRGKTDILNSNVSQEERPDPPFGGTRKDSGFSVNT